MSSGFSREFLGTVRAEKGVIVVQDGSEQYVPSSVFLDEALVAGFSQTLLGVVLAGPVAGGVYNLFGTRNENDEIVSIEMSLVPEDSDE